MNTSTQQRKRDMPLGISAFIIVLLSYLFLSEPIKLPGLPDWATRKKILEQKKFCYDKIPCVFDLGHGTGLDAKKYITDPYNYVKVLAVDANEHLINQSIVSFKAYMQFKKIKFLSVGLSPSNDEQNFWMNSIDHDYSSFNEQLGCRNGVTNCQKVQLTDTRSCSSLLKDFGKPLYLKIDIGHSNLDCFNSVMSAKPEYHPKYLSIRNNIDEDVLMKLSRAGYKYFKVVDHNQLEKSFLASNEQKWSGPWGENAVDYISGVKWVHADDILGRLPLPKESNGTRLEYTLHVNHVKRHY